MTAPTEDLIARLEGGPHEWGYRDPVEGGLIEDSTPFEAAQALRALQQEAERLREALGPFYYFARYGTSREYIKSEASDDGLCNAASFPAGAYRNVISALTGSAQG